MRLSSTLVGRNTDAAHGEPATEHARLLAYGVAQSRVLVRTGRFFAVHLVRLAPVAGQTEQQRRLAGEPHPLFGRVASATSSERVSMIRRSISAGGVTGRASVRSVTGVADRAASKACRCEGREHRPQAGRALQMRCHAHDAIRLVVVAAVHGDEPERRVAGQNVRVRSPGGGCQGGTFRVQPRRVEAHR